MSIVRYTNKKTGVVTLYESTSYYDPETKQSRPKRKYLGIEDPETGELIPSSGKRGRKKQDAGSESVSKQKKQEVGYKEKYDRLLQECKEKEAKIQQLEHDNKRLRYGLQKLRDAAANILSEQEL